MDEVRRKGFEKMKEVYGWELPDIDKGFFNLTVEHLFGTIWTRPELSMRDRRLLTLSTVATQGLGDLLEIQAISALNNGELTEAELREIAIFLTHYIGWPKGQKIDAVVEKVIANRQKGESSSESWKETRGG
ncbi:MAG TPA: carboxymuconolactone decarboxylase family protein [Mycobacterium sp.]|nr:carboxymuconolactone decarboxylase family protein [Mycobacterium sp.]